jgi:hypothetical protein
MLADAPFLAILMDHELREITHVLEEQCMQSEEQAHNVRADGRVVAEPLPQHEDEVPVVKTSTSVPQRRLTTRELARRRRQRLREMLQHRENAQPAEERSVGVSRTAREHGV